MVVTNLNINGNCDASTAESSYYNKFYHYYSVYSDYYDTEFIVVFKKQLLNVSCFGCLTPEEQLSDNLEDAINRKRYLEIIENELSNYDYTLNQSYSIEESIIYSNIKVKINDEFNLEYYNSLIELKNRMQQEKEELLTNNQGVSLDYLDIKFDNIEFSCYLSYSCDITTINKSR